MIIDNNIYSFALNLENGIPVHNFLGDKNDTCLLQVINYLDYIKDFSDLRKENERIYEFRKMYNSNIEDCIEFYYSDQFTSIGPHEEDDFFAVDANDTQQQSEMDGVVFFNPSEGFYTPLPKVPIVH